jgi:hypothetical protein
MVRFPRSGLLLLAACVFLPSLSTIPDGVAAAEDDSAAVVPSNIHVSSVLAPVFGRVLAVTLADQCQRIGRAKYVHVRVTAVLAVSTTSRGRARTTIRRFSSGALLAAVSIPVPLTRGEYAELFGHELEHIIEQIDRVNLEALALAGGDATRLSDGAYETVRAHRVGLTIADEYEHPRPSAVTPALQTRARSAAAGRQ